jgi:hypothetical protein
MALFPTWTSLYDTIDLLADDGKLFDIGDTAKRLTDRPDRLEAMFTDHPVNFLITRGPGARPRSVVFYHQVGCLPPMIGMNTTAIAAHGNGRGTTTFKEISLAHATEGMVVADVTTPAPRPGRKGPKSAPPSLPASIPTYEEFLAVESADAFKGLVSESGTRGVNTLSLQPSCLLVHYRHHRLFGGVRIMTAAEAGAHALRFAAGAALADPTLDEGGLSSNVLYDLLVFLWATAQGYTRQTSAGDPPDTSDISDYIQGVRVLLEEANQPKTTPTATAPAPPPRPEPDQKTTSTPDSWASDDDDDKDDTDDNVDDEVEQYGIDGKPANPQRLSRALFNLHPQEASRRRRSKSPDQRRKRSRSPTGHDRSRRRRGEQTVRSRREDRSAERGGPYRPRDRHSGRRGSPTRDPNQYHQHYDARAPRQPSHAMSIADQQNLMMVSAIQAMNQNATLQRAREDNKTSMLSAFDEDTGRLFTLLSARDWDDDYPVLTPFMVKLTKDKNATKALNLVQGATRQWEGRICKSGLLNFLSQGYLCSPDDERPTGFTLFMHHPNAESIERAPKERQNKILAMFGDQEINDDTAKHYADAKLFIAHDLDSFRHQLDTCIASLELFTAPRGVASEGYRALRTLIRERPQYFREQFRRDQSFGVKLGSLVDKVFQDFLDRLMSHIGRRSPIRAAARRLEFAQADAIHGVFSQIDLGITPALALPRSWAPHGYDNPWNPQQLPPQQAPHKPDGPPATFPGKGEGVSRSAEKIKNQSVKKEWALPPGKAMAEFFNSNSKDPQVAGNLKGWPETFDARLNKKAPICLKFHVAGTCRSGCYLSHGPASTLSSSEAAAVTARLKKIYKM